MFNAPKRSYVLVKLNVKASQIIALFNITLAKYTFYTNQKKKKSSFTLFQNSNWSNFTMIFFSFLIKMNIQRRIYFLRMESVDFFSVYKFSIRINNGIFPLFSYSAMESNYTSTHTSIFLGRILLRHSFCDSIFIRIKNNVTNRLNSKSISKKEWKNWKFTTKWLRKIDDLYNLTQLRWTLLCWWW